MTEDQKIIRVLSCCGKAPRSAWAFDAAEKRAVAALCDERGLLVAGGQEKFRLLMVDHYERRKATSEEFEVPAENIKTEILEAGLTYEEAASSELPTPKDSE
jgi:hypothetical protein